MVTTVREHGQEAALAMLYPLSEVERAAARQRAREQVISEAIGQRPTRRQFEGQQGDYPAWLVLMISTMLGVAFAGAFITSAFNVFSAGRNHAADVLAVPWQAAAVGVAIVLLAEFLTIASVLAMQILMAGQRRRWLMLFPTALGVAIALTGNAVMSNPSTWWEWLVTAAPPVSVVFLSLILEALALDAIRRRHAIRKAYEDALADWQRRTANPEQLPHFQQIYANHLRDALRAKNERGRGQAERIALMQQLTGHEWSALVWREMHAERWFTETPELTINPTGPGPAPRTATLLIPASPTGRQNGQGVLES